MIPLLSRSLGSAAGPVRGPLARSHMTTKSSAEWRSGEIRLDLPARGLKEAKVQGLAEALGTSLEFVAKTEAQLIHRLDQALLWAMDRTQGNQTTCKPKTKLRHTQEET